MSSFSKKVLIDAAELDRMQQSQIRTYSPELHSLAQLHNQMIEIIGNKALSSDQKLNLLSNYQGRFDKLKKQTGVLVGTQGEPEATADTPTPQVLVPEPDVQEPVNMIEKMGIQPMYRNKAIKLLAKIEKNPNILNYTKDGQVIIRGEPIPGTDFESLFKSMISPRPNLDQIGTDRFMGALHEIGVKPSELSGRAVQNRFTKSMLMKVANSDESSTEFKTPAKKQSSSTVKIASPAVKEKKTVAQKGKGLKRKTPTPPGTRPKILYVY